MPAATEKNIYGLSEGVLKACLYLGLQFPPTAPNDAAQEKIPSDYFGDDFELNEAMKERLRAERKWTKENFDRVYNNFSKKFSSQKTLNHSKTNLNVYFCDHVLFSGKQGASIDNYFDFEFYNKSFEIRDTFTTERLRNQIRMFCNNPWDMTLANNKVKTNKIFADFLRRDWLDTRTCTFEEFKAFAEKHRSFFSKPVASSFGMGAAIISVESTESLKELFESLKSRNRLVEEIVNQHKDIAAFCPDTVNTIRVCTFLDIHNDVHILTTGGRFGRVGSVVDNFHGGGVSVIVDPITGIITSDALNRVHERVQTHPDTGKTFKGFKYPAWDKVRTTVTKMARMIPQLRHIGWDIAVDDKGEAVIIEANARPDVDVQQAPDDTGRRYLYQPLIDEMINYNAAQMKLLGYRINNIPDFYSAYTNLPAYKDTRLKFAMGKLIPDCKSLMDLGCRKAKLVKTVCSKDVKYYPVDFQKHDDEVIACDFNGGEFPDIKADTCLCAFTAEYVERLPQFLADMCNAANKQILILCRPADKELYPQYRWEHPFLTDFTEEFLIAEMKRNDCQLVGQYPVPDNAAIILYDFRKIS